MRNLTYYYAIGFAVAGLMMFVFAVLTFSWMPSRTGNPWDTAMLIIAMILPFLISILSWRDWGRLQKTTDMSQRS